MLIDALNAADLRGTLTPDRPMSELSWLRTGGAADLLYQPSDADDLTAFLAALPSDAQGRPSGH